MSRVTFQSLLLALILCSSPAVAQQVGPADLVLQGGKVITVDADALLREPELATAFYYKGLFLFQEGENLARGGQNPFGVHAIRLLECSAELLPNPRTSLALAEAYLRFGQQQRAIEAAQTARVEPALAARAYHIEALAHHELLEYELAEASYRDAIEAGSDSAELYYDLGNLLSVMGRWAEAETTLEGAPPRDPQLGGALRWASSR